MKPSKERQKQDWQMATTIARQNKFGDYNETLNPFKDDTFRNERFERYYKKICDQFHYYDPIFRGICEAYGYTPPEL